MEYEARLGTPQGEQPVKRPNLQCRPQASEREQVKSPARRRMLTESLGDELAAKDLIDNALATDEFKWVCVS